MRRSSPIMLTSPPPLPETTRGGGQTEGLEHFQRGYERPPSGTMEGDGRQEVASLKKHGLYKLVSASSVPAGQKVVGSRWVNKIEADDLFKSRLVVLG